MPTWNKKPERHLSCIWWKYVNSLIVAFSCLERVRCRMRFEDETSRLMYENIRGWNACPLPDTSPSTWSCRSLHSFVTVMSRTKPLNNTKTKTSLRASRTYSQSRTKKHLKNIIHVRIWEIKITSSYRFGDLDSEPRISPQLTKRNRRKY